MRTLSLACYNRPDYLNTTLKALAKCDWSKFDRLFISIEHNAPVVVRNICKNINWIPTTIQIADKKLGCDRNTYRSICAPFEAGSDFNVYMEDDILVSEAYSDLANWYADHNDQKYAFLCTEVFDMPPAADNELLATKTFNAHGFMCNKQQFEAHIKPQWLNYKPGGPQGWDWNIMRYITEHPTLQMLNTAKSYSHHIGINGVHCNRKVYEELKQNEVVLCRARPKTFTIKA